RALRSQMLMTPLVPAFANHLPSELNATDSADSFVGGSEKAGSPVSESHRPNVLFVPAVAISFPSELIVRSLRVPGCSGNSLTGRPESDSRISMRYSCGLPPTIVCTPATKVRPSRLKASPFAINGAIQSCWPLAVFQTETCWRKLELNEDTTAMRLPSG